jgi:hypothetical protein
MKDLHKYLYEDYICPQERNRQGDLDNKQSDDTNIDYIQKNIKNDKYFNKFIKICMKYKIYLFHKVDDKYQLRSNKNLIILINRKKSEITNELGKMILKLHNFDKYLETSTSDNFSDIYDTKNRIDILYKEFDKNYRYLDELIKMLKDKLNDVVLHSLVSSENESPLNNNQNNNNIIIEEFSN